MTKGQRRGIGRKEEGESKGRRLPPRHCFPSLLPPLHLLSVLGPHQTSSAALAAPTHLPARLPDCLLASAVKGVRVWGNPFWGRFSKGIVDWLAINAVMWLALVAQLTEFFGSLKVWWFVAAGYTALVVVHAVLSTRDG